MTLGNSSCALARISDLGRVVTGKTPPTKQLEFFGDKYPFITPTDIADALHTVETERFLSEKGRMYLKNYLLPPGSVCFVCIGATIGKICITTLPSFTNQQINSIVVDETKHDKRFVYYLLRYNAELIKGRAGGAATPIINKSAFSEVELPAPPLRIQHKIASILSAYDDLIENSSRRIKILEEMAQAVYREWFVNFRFPGHEKVKIVESELGMIPEGWEAKPLKDVAEVIDCLHSKKPEEEKEPKRQHGFLLQLWNIGENGKMDFSKTFMISEESYKLWTSRIEVRGGDCVITNVGRIGAVAQVPDGIRAAIGRNMTAVRCRESILTPTLLIEYLLSPHMEREKQLKQDAGTIMGSLNVRGINKILVPVPPIELMEHFEITARPLRHRIELLQKQNSILLRTRDLLLPKLISGELDVSELDIKTEVVEA